MLFPHAKTSKRIYTFSQTSMFLPGKLKPQELRSFLLPKLRKKDLFFRILPLNRKFPKNSLWKIIVEKNYFIFSNYRFIRKTNREFSGICDKTVLKILKFYVVLNLRKDERFYLCTAICR